MAGIRRPDEYNLRGDSANGTTGTMTPASVRNRMQQGGSMAAGAPKAGSAYERMARHLQPYAGSGKGPYERGVMQVQRPDVAMRSNPGHQPYTNRPTSGPGYNGSGINPGGMYGGGVDNNPDKWNASQAQGGRQMAPGAGTGTGNQQYVDAYRNGQRLQGGFGNTAVYNGGVDMGPAANDPKWYEQWTGPNSGPLQAKYHNTSLDNAYSGGTGGAQVPPAAPPQKLSYEQLWRQHQARQPQQAPPQGGPGGPAQPPAGQPGQGQPGSGQGGSGQPGGAGWQSGPRGDYSEGSNGYLDNLQKQLSSYYANQRTEGERALRASAALTGMQNGGGFGDVLGDYHRDMSLTQGREGAQAMLGVNESQQERMLKNALARISSGDSRYAADRGVDAASLGASAQISAAQLGADASRYNAGLDYDLGKYSTGLNHDLGMFGIYGNMYNTYQNNIPEYLRIMQGSSNTAMLNPFGLPSGGWY